MCWDIEYTDEFEAWWNGLTLREQSDAAKVVDLLVARGTALGSPQSSQVKSSRHPHMRELRIQSGGPMRSMISTFSSSGARGCWSRREDGSDEAPALARAVRATATEDPG